MYRSCFLHKRNDWMKFIDIYLQETNMSVVFFKYFIFINDFCSYANTGWSAETKLLYAGLG